MVEHARSRAIGLMLASGFAGLGAQIAWTQQAALWLGHDSTAALSVVAAFFGGLAFGALVFSPRLERHASPLRAYAGCEAIVGAWGLVLAFGMPSIGRLLLSIVGPEASPVRQGIVAFGGVFLLLLPATAAMGATLPLMARLSEALQSRGARVAALYAANTGGALLAVLAALAGALPNVGFRNTAMACAMLNLLCAAVALRLGDVGAPSPRVDDAGDLTRGEGRGQIYVILAATGLLGIGCEVLVLRVLSQVAEDTVYTFAAVLAVYLLFTALGAALHAACAPRIASARHRARLLLALSLATVACGATLWTAESQRVMVASALGPNVFGAVAAEASLAVSALALPAALMGALFCHLMSEARQAGVTYGRALGVNTAAAAAAPLLMGVWAAPSLGAKSSLMLLTGGYLAIAAMHRGTRVAALAAALPIAIAAVVAPPLTFVDVPDGGHVIRYEEGPLAAVSVVEDPAGAAVLRINNREQEGSSVTVLADARQALLPLLLHPSPRHALFVGFGTGITAHAATFDTRMLVDAVELLPEVVDASAEFTPALRGAADQSRLQVHVADARRFVRTATKRYDVIVADNFQPARSGSGSLYTVEHFDAVRRRLADGGLFCQWLPLHQLDLPTLRSIVRSYMAVFPQARAVLATNSLLTPTIGLVSHDGAAGFVARSAAGFAVPLQVFGLADDFAVLGSFVAGPSALAVFAREAPLNTDDRPAVAWMAPRATYAEMPSPSVRLMELLAVWHVSPAEIIVQGMGDRADGVFASRLAAYIEARRQFVAAGISVRPDPDPQRMLDQVREPLLAVLRTSPDFAPAREPLLRLAEALRAQSPASSSALEQQLATLSPR